MKKSITASIRRSLVPAVSSLVLLGASAAFAESTSTSTQGVPSATQDHNISQPNSFGDNTRELRDNASDALSDSANEAERNLDRAGNRIENAADNAKDELQERGIVSDDSHLQGRSLEISTGDNQTQHVPVKTLVDLKVINQQGKELGEVDSVVQPQAGGPASVLLEVGGVLGIGDREIVIPLDELRLVGQELIWDTNLDASQLKDAQNYQYEEDRYSRLPED